jgi:hypothetical protein
VCGSAVWASVKSLIVQGVAVAAAYLYNDFLLDHFSDFRLWLWFGRHLDLFLGPGAVEYDDYAEGYRNERREFNALNFALNVRLKWEG